MTGRTRDSERRIRQAERVIRDARAEINRHQFHIKALERLIEVHQRSIAEAGSPEAPPTLPEQIRKLMADGVRRSTAEVADALGADRSDVGDAMKRILRQRGYGLVRLSDGVYIRIKPPPRPRVFRK